MQDLKLRQPPRNHSMSKFEHTPGWSDGIGPIGATRRKLLICLAALLRRCPSCIARGGITHQLQLVFDNWYAPVWPGGMRRALYMYILMAHDYICMHINNHIYGKKALQTLQLFSEHRNMRTCHRKTKKQTLHFVQKTPKIR